MIVSDRMEAARELAKLLNTYKSRDDLLVLGIPRRGVPVAFQVAAELHTPLDVFVVCKLGVPGREELAFGAIASGGIRFLDSGIVEDARISELEIELIAVKERQELERRERVYRGGRSPVMVKG
jgi:putative phosphoribosyl transferase